MNICIIRHAKVNMKWEKLYNSKSYDLACDKYNISDIISNNEDKQNIDNEKLIYISELIRTYKTAQNLFNTENFYKTPLINEVPLKSFMDLNRKLPVWVWDIIGRIQWVFNNMRQPETRNQSIDRARKAIKLIEDNNKDCILITHGFFMKVLIKQLTIKGYKIQSSSKFKISNLDKIIAIK